MIEILRLLNHKKTAIASQLIAVFYAFDNPTRIIEAASLLTIKNKLATLHKAQKLSHELEQLLRLCCRSLGFLVRHKSNQLVQ